MKVLPRLSFTRLLGVAAMALTLVGFTGCVSQDEHKRLQTAFDQARAQLAEAENDLAQARAKIAELEAKIADLNRLLAAAGGNSEAFNRLQQQLAELQDKYNKLLALADKPALPENINDLLRRLVEQYPDLLEFDERLGMVRLKSDLTFDLGSTEVKPRAKEALKKFAAILNLKEIANNEITVVGHTDDVPIRKSTTMTMNPTNWALSTNRAWSILAVLHDNGLAENRGEGAGWGDQRPIAPNAAGHKGAEKNRRVDIYIRPTTVPEGIVVSTPGAAPAPRPVAPRKTAPRTPAAPAAPAPTTAPASTVPIPM